MVLLRNAYQRNDEMIEGTWPRQAASGRETAGKVLGLLGFGAIARETARLARAVGMSVIAHDPFVPDDDSAWAGVTRMEQGAVIEGADVLSLHVPLLPETRHLIDARAIASMKPDAILINAARGGVVDESALVDALRAGKLGGAALDVYETEPLTQDAAQIFRGVPNLVLTPHIGGVTVEANTRVSAMIADAVLDRLG